MHSVLVAVGILSGCVGVAFLLGGFMMLMAVDKNEATEVDRLAKLARREGGLSEVREARRTLLIYTNPARLVRTWPRRPQVHPLIYFGTGFTLFALVIAILL